MPPIRVAVIGAGIAGLTVALRLVERGYDVTIYDEKSYIGGKLGAHTHPRSDFEGPSKKPYLGGAAYRPDTYHEHCYHMFLSWYHNFWQLAEDFGLRRGEHFEARDSVKYLGRGEFPRTRSISNSGSLTTEWANLTSGVRSFPDMILSHYSVFDTLAQRFEDGLLGTYTVNGFVQSRPYASEGMATLYQEGLAKAFACPSYLTSARSYQAFLKYSMRLPAPMMWLLKNDVHHGFTEPLRAKLDGLGCHWKLGHAVKSLRNDFIDGIMDKVPPEGGTVMGSIVVRAIPSSNPAWPHPPWPNDSPPRVTPPEDVAAYDYAVLAVPPSSLRTFLIDSEFAGYLETRSDETVEKLHFEPIASIDLYFKRKLDLPREHIVLTESRYGLTMVDNSQLWPGLEGTVLNVAATDFRPLVHLSEFEALRKIVTELEDYLPFDEDDITYWHIETNAGDKLFVNEIGSEKWRPGPTTNLPNLFLAGDYCRTFIDVVTVEGAVVSGLLAVRALQEQVARYEGARTAGTTLLDPVTIVEPEAYPQWMMLAAAAMLAPYAAAAKVWSWLDTNVVRGDENAPALDAPSLLQTATSIAWMPWQIAADVMNAGWSTYAAFWRGDAKSRRYRFR